MIGREAEEKARLMIGRISGHLTGCGLCRLGGGICWTGVQILAPVFEALEQKTREIEGKGGWREVVALLSRSGVDTADQSAT